MEAREFGISAQRHFSLPQLLGELLYQRGLRSIPELHDFLYPQLSMLPSPESMRGMRKAVAILIAACKKKKSIFIHGDYDVDGISASALLYSFFTELGLKEVFAYIPNRLEEQHGLSTSSIERLLGQSQRSAGGVLITADCGISNVTEVLFAKKLGLQVIITDHHEPPPRLPEADATLNPKQKNCRFPYKQLSGVGVVFFLLMALRRALAAEGFWQEGKRPNLKQYLDLVALGTIADMVPLTGVNRILARAGLEVLGTTNRFGLRALLRTCGIHGALDSEHISFRLAPRINASGRLGQPGIGFELLVANDGTQADRLINQLESMNTRRRELEATALPFIVEQCEEQVQAGIYALSACHQESHPGVLGILASKMVNSYRRPVIVFSHDSREGYLKGSGRSVADINLFHLLEKCSFCIEQFGGHAMATGLTISKLALPEFGEALHHQMQLLGKKPWLDCRIPVDYELRDKSLLHDDNFMRALQLLQPFGEGNPEPIFLLKQEQLLHARAVKGHVVFQIRMNGRNVPGICFHHQYPDHSFMRPVDVVFRWRQSCYHGNESQQVQALYLLA